MAHGYNKLHNWNQWLSQQSLGLSLLHGEQTLLREVLQNHYGKQSLLIGVPRQQGLLDVANIHSQAILTPLTHSKNNYTYIEGDLHELPILSGSVDLVLLPHTLEFVDNPRQLIAETCRIVRPEGLIAIFGFNPYSCWGMKRRFAPEKNGPWSINFNHSYVIKNWLRLADFALEQEKWIMYRPPVKNITFYQKLAFLEKFSSYIMPRFGSIYLLVARAKVIPLTPIRMKWKQHIGGLRIPTSLTGHSLR